MTKDFCDKCGEEVTDKNSLERLYGVVEENENGCATMVVEVNAKKEEQIICADCAVKALVKCDVFRRVFGITYDLSDEMIMKIAEIYQQNLKQAMEELKK